MKPRMRRAESIQVRFPTIKGIHAFSNFPQGEIAQQSGQCCDITKILVTLIAEA